MEQLDKASLHWVSSAKLGDHSSLPPLPGTVIGEPDSYGVRNSTQLRTAAVGTIFFPAATQGIVLLEPFGGLCAGLDMVLRNGTAVKQYYYLDTNPASRQIAAQRLQQLMALYTLLLPASAVQNAFSLPQDIRKLTTRDLVAAGASTPKHPWLVVAGWPCQHLSQAGSGAGLQGERSGLLQDLVRVIGTLQQLQPEMPPGYVIENVAMQFHSNPAIAQQEFMRICSMIGQPTVLDAAQFGSLAHRVRNFWTNLCTPAQLCAASAQVVRPANRTVSIALGPGRHPQLVKAADRFPRYCCNKPGELMTAWATFMAHQNSYAFRPGQPGSVTTSTGEYDQPTAAEREYALGYAIGSTAAPGVTEQQRRAALGESMDSHCMQWLFAITRAWWRAECPQQCGSACMPQQPAAATTSNTAGHNYTMACALAIAAAAQEALQKPDANHTDIWHDAAALHLLQQGELPSDTSAAEKSRINKRLQYYTWYDGKLLRLMPDNSTRIVPPPADRLQLIKDCHDRTGHFGIRRTTSLLLHTWWWHGIQADAASVVSACKECSRVRATFNAKLAELQPLPIKVDVPLGGGSSRTVPRDCQGARIPVHCS
jgi:site-specific DNA-cytosine methylase